MFFNLLLRFKVSGHSMIPTFKEGQEILISSLPYFFSSPKVGDIIAFKDKEKFITKRIREVSKDRVLVKGDNTKDSKEYGWINRKKIIGKVILKLN